MRHGGPPNMPTFIIPSQRARNILLDLNAFHLSKGSISSLSISFLLFSFSIILRQESNILLSWRQLKERVVPYIQSSRRAACICLKRTQRKCPHLLMEHAVNDVFIPKISSPPFLAGAGHHIQGRAQGTRETGEIWDMNNKYCLVILDCDYEPYFTV